MIERDVDPEKSNKRHHKGGRKSGVAILKIVLTLLTLVMPACKGFIVNPTLSSIAVTPATPSITSGSTQQMAATGTYNDGSTKTLTSSATWTSSDASVATVGSSGLVTGISAGTASITATSGSISGATTVAVTLANLKSIEVTPTTVSITSGETQAFVATATLDDDTTVVITDGVTWASSNTSAATIASTGIATAQTLATSASTYVTASSGSITSNSALLTVNP